MRKTLYIMSATTIILFIAPVYSFEPEEGFYAEYRLFESYRDSSAFALLKNQSLEIKHVYLDDMVYKYQVLDKVENTMNVRISIEGILNGGYDDIKKINFPFRKIFDVKVNCDTLEIFNGDGAWGKWPFWIKLGSYDWKRYTVMKNWNGHGEVIGWLKGPWENLTLSKFLRSSCVNELEYYFILASVKKEGENYLYPKFETYNINRLYKAYETEEGTIRIEPGGYYLGGFEVTPGTEEEGVEMHGVLIRYYYTDEGLFFEHILPYYIDDFIDQKLGITILRLSSPFVLADYGISDKIVIEDPKPENQTSLSEDVKKHMQEPETPSETPEKTETSIKTEQKSEKPSPTTTQSNDAEKNNTLFYIAPLLVVAVIAVFLVLKEKR